MKHIFFAVVFLFTACLWTHGQISRPTTPTSRPQMITREIVPDPNQQPLLRYRPSTLNFQKFGTDPVTAEDVSLRMMYIIEELYVKYPKQTAEILSKVHASLKYTDKGKDIEVGYLPVDEPIPVGQYQDATPSPYMGSLSRSAFPGKVEVPIPCLCPAASPTVSFKIPAPRSINLPEALHTSKATEKITRTLGIDVRSGQATIVVGIEPNRRGRW